MVSFLAHYISRASPSQKHTPLPLTNPKGKGGRGIGHHCLCEERSDEAISGDKLIYMRLLRLWLAMTPAVEPRENKKTTDAKTKSPLAETTNGLLAHATLS